MTVVQIGSQNYDTYADISDADLYLAGAYHAASWASASDEDKAKLLVTATRILDRQVWLGNKTVADQPLAWPRSNTGIAGVTNDIVPVNIVNASIELALALLDGALTQSQQSTAERVRSMSAGSVSIAFFRGVDIATRFPLIVQELVKDYLGSAAAGFARGVVTGVDAESIFPVDLGFTRGL